MPKFNKHNNKGDNPGKAFVSNDAFAAYDNAKKPQAPSPEKIAPMTSFIAKQQLSQMYRNTYSVAANPYQDALPQSAPIPLVNTFNKVTSGNYIGSRNIEGGTTNQYTNTQFSKFLNAFDIIKTRIGLNYRYLPIAEGTKHGSELTNKMIATIDEAISIWLSEAYTQQAFYNYAIKTDLPMGDAELSVYTLEDGNTIELYDSPGDVLFGTAIYYQTYLQSVAKCFNKFSHFRAYQGEMLRMEYERNVAILNDFFGVMNKKSTLSKLNSLAINLEGEYFDKGWLRQTNTMSILTSRRAEAILDPLLEIDSAHIVPNITLYIVDRTEGTVLGKVYDSKEYDAQFIAPLFKDENLDYAPGLQDLCFEFEDLCSIYSTLRWARTSDSETSNIRTHETAVGRNNRIIEFVNALVKYTNLFKKKFNDFRTVLDTIAKTGIIRWEKNLQLHLIKSTDMQVENYLIVNQIVREALSGAAEVGFDNDSQRLKCFSLWDMYYGVPQYALYQGGVFISLSCKDLPEGSLMTPYLPIAFTTGKIGGRSAVIAMNRLGHEFAITSYDATARDLSNTQLIRLFPLASQENLTLKIPTVEMNYTTDSPVDIAFLKKAMLSIFGYCRTVDQESNTDYDIDTDIIAIYQYQIDDLIDNAIAYARWNGPFRGSETDDSTFGFWGVRTGESEKKDK